MAKEKMTISLDKEVKESLIQVAKEKHMTVSALITQFTLSHNVKQIQGQLSMEEIKKKKGEEIMKVGRLGYNCENDRYGLLISDLWENDGFHCGECLEILVDDKWIPTRMEMTDGKWYLVGTQYKGDLEYIQARIKD